MYLGRLLINWGAGLISLNRRISKYNKDMDGRIVLHQMRVAEAIQDESLNTRERDERIMASARNLIRGD